MAGTITGTIERIHTPQGRPPIVVIELTCTGDADDGSYPQDVVVNDLENIVDYDIRGLRLYSVATVPGGTGPTDNSDFTLIDQYGADILAGAGANLIDNAAINRTVLGPNSAVIITGDIIPKIASSIVHSAVTKIVLELIGV